MAHPTVSPRTYFAVYVALLLLTILTASLAMFAHLGAVEVPVALGIAGVKTVLVGLYFMHLIHSDKLTWLIILGGLLCFVIMIMAKQTAC